MSYEVELSLDATTIRDEMNGREKISKRTLQIKTNSIMEAKAIAQVACEMKYVSCDGYGNPVYATEYISKISENNI